MPSEYLGDHKSALLHGPAAGAAPPHHAGGWRGLWQECGGGRQVGQPPRQLLRHQCALQLLHLLRLLDCYITCRGYIFTL